MGEDDDKHRAFQIKKILNEKMGRINVKRNECI